MTPDGHPTYHLTQAALREPDLTITPAGSPLSLPLLVRVDPLPATVPPKTRFSQSYIKDDDGCPQPHPNMVICPSIQIFG